MTSRTWNFVLFGTGLIVMGLGLQMDVPWDRSSARGAGTIGPLVTGGLMTLLGLMRLLGSRAKDDEQPPSRRIAPGFFREQRSMPTADSPRVRSTNVR